jgi:coatomer subunit beta
MLAAEEKYEAALKASGESESFPATTSTENFTKVSTKILADGTYASEIKDEGSTGNNSRQLPNIKSTKIIFKIGAFILFLELLLDGKFECSGVLADSLCKLMIRLKSSKIDSSQFLALRTRVLLMLTSILRLGGSKYVAQPIDRDSAERIALCIQILLSNDNSNSSSVVGDLEKALTVESEAAFNSIQQKGGKRALDSHLKQGQVDDFIEFKLLSHFKMETQIKALSLSPEDAINLVLNENSANSSNNNSHKASLNRVVQLTGFSDAIYAETYVQMAGKEVLLDLLLVNQTEETLQSVSIDLVCAGDLKLVEKPAQLTLPPYSFSACKAIFRVTATNHGQIFGCISYLTGPTGQDAETVILSEIKIDVLEYVKPAQIDETLFRDVWILLEWENKISIKVPKNATCNDLKSFLEYLMRQGNLVCITPNVFINDESDTNNLSFLACNLYAKSIFGIKPQIK